MKKLIVMAVVASAVFAVVGATYEENLALVRTPLDQINAGNVQAVCNAAIAITNASKVISKCRDKGLLSFADVQSLLADKPWMENEMYANAVASSNVEVRAACYTALENFACAGDVTASSLIYATWRTFGTTAAQRLATGKKIITAGYPIRAIQILYGGIPQNVVIGRQTDPYYTEEYMAWCRENYESMKSAWLAAAPTLNAAGNPINFWSDGGDIVFWGLMYCRAKIASWSTMDAFTDKTLVYLNAGQWVMAAAHDSTFFKKCLTALAKCDKLKMNYRITAAKRLDAILKNKTATETLWPALVDDADKINIALYLNDVDKLIDTLKNVGDKLDAKTVESIIIPLNGVNAGYRTNDLRLALANVNKKYTLKLYDDRDTWEPILSKIRAMIDAL